MSERRSACPPAGHDWSDPVLDCLTDGILAVDRDGTIVHVNLAATTIFGWDRDELVGKPIELLVPDSYREAHLRDRARYAERPVPRKMGALTLRALRKDGSTFFAEIALNPCECGHVTTVVRDVSERIETQNRLIGRDRADTFELAAAGLVHEINNPLAFVVPNLDLAVSLLERPLPDTHRALGAIQDARTGIGQIVEILHAFREISRRPDRVSIITPFETIESVLRLVRTRLRGRVSLARELGNVPQVRIDPTRLGQVLLNILINASQAFASDDPQHNQIIVRTLTDETGRPVIEIEDNAGGVPEAIRGRIFDPFFTTKKAGTGLGLAVSRTALREVGGDLTFTTFDTRTIFRVLLAPAEETSGIGRERAKAP